MNVVWKDRKRPVFGLPLSFTKYTLSEEKLIINTGVLTVNEEEVRTYRMVDFSVKQTLFDRIFNVGTIYVESSDKSSGNFEIKKVKKPRDVKNMLSEIVETQREKKRVSVREFMDSDTMDEVEYE
ncbi:MAG: PH domain-containing protein [Lachnospiraceae bacterium]